MQEFIFGRRENSNHYQNIESGAKGETMTFYYNPILNEISAIRRDKKDGYYGKIDEHIDKDNCKNTKIKIPEDGVITLLELHQNLDTGALIYLKFLIDGKEINIGEPFFEGKIVLLISQLDVTFSQILSYTSRPIQAIQFRIADTQNNGLNNRLRIGGTRGSFRELNSISSDIQFLTSENSDFLQAIKIGDSRYGSKTADYESVKITPPNNDVINIERVMVEREEDNAILLGITGKTGVVPFQAGTGYQLPSDDDRSGTTFHHGLSSESSGLNVKIKSIYSNDFINSIEFEVSV